MLRGLERFSATVNRALAWFAGLALAAMMLFTVFDVLMRTIGRPVAGSFEVIGWLSAAAMALGVGYAHLHRSHVAMTLVSDRLRGRLAAFAALLTGLLSFALFAAVAWFVGNYALTLFETGSLSETLKAAVYPWVFLVAIGFVGLALALLLDVLRSLQRLATG